MDIPVIRFYLYANIQILLGGLFPLGVTSAPYHAYLGGVFSVLYVVGGSWAIVRMGAANTALLVVCGQVQSGVVLDIMDVEHIPNWELFSGVVLILGGVVLIQRQRR
ncbi:MAG: DMT family transporter [Alphaproteobacteria bacterium]|nr:DMT family transporter [Alphaproteobacteria bacterium]